MSNPMRDMKKEILAWHFFGDTLRDGRPIPKDGVWLKHHGIVAICSTGLHASREPFDALQYAPGPNAALVRCRGIVDEQEDKLVCRERKIISRMDASEMLRYFARQQALSVVHLWDAPQTVLDYLMTGDPQIRGAARDAAWGAAGGAARDAAWGAAGGAAWAAARGAARDAAWAAAWGAAGGAAWAAARKDFNALVYECFRVREE